MAAQAADVPGGLSDQVTSEILDRASHGQFASF
jgi:hypothetical protein